MICIELSTVATSSTTDGDADRGSGCETAEEAQKRGLIHTTLQIQLPRRRRLLLLHRVCVACYLLFRSLC